MNAEELLIRASNAKESLKESKAALQEINKLLAEFDDCDFMQDEPAYTGYSSYEQAAKKQDIDLL